MSTSNESMGSAARYRMLLLYHLHRSFRISSLECLTNLHKALLPPILHLHTVFESTKLCNMPSTDDIVGLREQIKGNPTHLPHTVHPTNSHSNSENAVLAFFEELEEFRSWCKVSKIHCNDTEAFKVYVTATTQTTFKAFLMNIVEGSPRFIAAGEYKFSVGEALVSLMAFVHVEGCKRYPALESWLT